ncbi:MAG: potassium transporter Kup [Proteobacteria bacterium]|uniref:Probable potassium transport system protein Kup n=1 Tax=Candidatus Fonsibacter lacus TaxID=2576439 RepID=A0A964XQI1_9PROT|nr:potassium transporter Kup [Candidatus Fonsibacter lacus]
MNNKNGNGRSLPLLIIAALGVVFGDIGTSPLYALKLSVEATEGSGAGLTSSVLGVLSLITWALIIVVSIKYILIIMRADNHGEGGVFALTALLLRKLDKKSKNSKLRWFVIILGTLGAALFFGDSLITPAISVLSAVEGLKVVSPQLGKYVIYISLALVSILFAIEKFGTGKIGTFFGPIMLLWFVTIGYFGLLEIIDKPSILRALNPMYGLNFLFKHQGVSIAILGAIVLAITGGEALYSDMGHFGRSPIKFSWFLIVFPALLLNYFGQGALLISEPKAIDNPFYRLAPDWALIPLIILASTATIIASQAVISGVFSITSQAVQLGYIPRLRVKHTSDKEYGEVYLSKINLFLFLGVALLIIGFKSSENLSHAYGISVTGAMLVDTILATYLLITVRKWNKLIFIPVFLGLLIIDFVFLSSNLVKIFDGGWFPIVIASGLLVIMLSWIIGRERMLAARWNGSIKINQFISQLKRNRIKRVPGTAIFFVPNLKVVPMAMLHNLKHNKILHKRIVCMHLKFENFPKLRNDERLIVKHLGSNFYTIIVRYGFQEEPNIPRVLALLRASEFKFNMEETSFFVGKVKVIAKDPSIITRLFIFMHRIMMGATEYYKIPKERTVELGGVIEI